ncbi:MAG: hypothetical protein ACUVTM_05195 [Candidatus Bathyarchaeia archaeon]
MLLDRHMFREAETLTYPDGERGLRVDETRRVGGASTLKYGAR